MPPAPQHAKRRQPLVHGDDLWLCYSASNCNTPNYSLGLLHWNGGDPLLASSWDKNGPVFAQANGLYGTAHNSFFTSPDGTEIWVRTNTPRHPWKQMLTRSRMLSTQHPRPAVLVAPTGSPRRTS